jgi:hypothetical protein
MQINDVWLDAARKMFGPATDMSVFLDPEKSWAFAQKNLKWSDWGLAPAGDGSSVSWDWRGWPSPYRPGESGAVASEQAFKYWWDDYPARVKKVFP